MNENTRYLPDDTRPDGSSKLDRLFDVLGHSHRRRILTALVEADPGDDVELGLANLGGDEDPEEVRIALHHVHLPRLEDLGSIEWDRRAGTIRPGPRYDEVAPVVELLIDHRDELPADWP